MTIQTQLSLWFLPNGEKGRDWERFPILNSSQHLISEMLVKGTDGKSKELSQLELLQNLCSSVNHMSKVKDWMLLALVGSSLRAGLYSTF